jgi:metal-dependent amidase/aminoacylase/carboxypeptidase family protein
MEFKTSELVQKELKSYGIEVRNGYAKWKKAQAAKI